MRPQALPAGADAGAAVPLQPRLRRLRQDRLSRRDPQPAPVGRGVPGGGRRVRRAGGGRSPAASRCCTGRSTRSSRASIARKKFVYLCTNALLLEKKLRPVQAQPVLRLVGASRRRPRDARPARCARTASMIARWPRSRAPRRRGFRVNINCTLFDGAEPERVATFFDDVMAMGVDGIIGFAGLCLRARARPGSISSTGARPRNCSATSSAAGKGTGKRRGRSTSRRLFLDFLAGNQSLPLHALGQPDAQRISAGSVPAICSAKATPRPSRS